jgi:competence protein ComEC
VTLSARPRSVLAPILLGVVLGAALQLQQARLWPTAVYSGAALASCALLLFSVRLRLPARPLAILAFATLLSAAATGWRAASFIATRLDPALEGIDLEVTGLVAAMPHRNEAGLRFRFEPESARARGQPVALPPQIMLGWYAGLDAGGEASLERASAEVRPGERWQWTVRLKAPHGHVNPEGFDYELWLWEQGIQATGYVRAGPRDPPPRRLAATWSHPLEQARAAVRAAIYRQVADPRLAGVLAALIVGDQGAIDVSSILSSSPVPAVSR